MTRYRAFVIPVVGLIIVLGGFLVFNLRDDLIYYQTPAEAIERRAEFSERRFRLGGQVVPGTVAAQGQAVTFEVTDGLQVVTVAHRGAPQQLFREGIGVVVEGQWDGSIFRSDTMLIKHDEQYRTEDGGVYTPDDRYVEP